MPTGQRYGGTDLLLPFESRHYSHSHQSLVTKTIMVITSNTYEFGRPVSNAFLGGCGGMAWLCFYLRGV